MTNDIITKEAKLTEVVQRMVDGGKWTTFHRVRFLGITHITTRGSEKLEYFINIEYLDGLFRRTRKLTPADLIADDAAMKAVFGEEFICTHCKKTNITKLRVYYCYKCGAIQEVPCTPASLYHAIEALKLLHAGGDAISYLYNNLPTNDKGE